MNKKFLLALLVFPVLAFSQVQIDKAIDLNGTGANAKITGIKDVSGTTDAVSAGVLQKGSLVYALAAGGPNAYTLTLTPALTSYTAGMEIRFMANVANAAGGTTLKVNALTALTIKKDVGTDLAAGDMQQDQLVSVSYDVVHNTFQLLSRTTDLNSGGTVTSVSVTTANGVSGTVANATTTPAISLSLGAITPSSVAATGNVTGANLSGTNTGDQTITLTNDVTGSGTGSFATTIAPNAVTNSKAAQMATKTYKGRTSALTGNPEDVPVATVKTDLGLSGTNSGDITLSGQNYLTLSGQALTAGAVDLSGGNATGTLAAGRFPALSGDVSTSAGSLTTTLATVNSNVGTFNNVTVNAKGLVTAASNTSYLTGNQTINFTPAAGGDVTGSASGTTSLTPTLTIGALKVTNGMLAGGIDLTNKVTGILPVANGGTGIGAAYSVGDMLYASAAGTFTKLPDVATGNALISGGIGTAPSWGKINLAAGGHVTGTLPVGNGGTGNTAFTAGSIVYSNGTILTQNNANLFWDNTNTRLGIGTTGPLGNLDIEATNANTYGHLIVNRSNATGVGGELSINNFGGGTGASAVLAFGTDNSTNFDAAGANQNNAEIRAVNNNGSTNATDLKFSNWSGSAEVTNMSILSTGVVQIPKLNGGGNKIVFADASGNLNTNSNAITKMDPFYIRGTGLDNNANAVVVIGGTTQVNTTTRGLTLTIISKSTHAVVSNTGYDTYGVAGASDNLATALNGITNAQIGILVSYDAWEGAVTTNLLAAFKRLGLYKALNTTIGGSRRPYAAIFEASSSSSVPSDRAVEVEYTNGVNEPYAEIRGWLMDGGFTATRNVPSGLSTPIGANAVNIDENGTMMANTYLVGSGTSPYETIYDPQGRNDNINHTLVHNTGYAMNGINILSTGYLDGDIRLNGSYVGSMLSGTTTWYGNAGTTTQGAACNNGASGGGNTKGPDQDGTWHWAYCPDNTVATGFEVYASGGNLDGCLRLRCTTLSTGYKTTNNTIFSLTTNAFTNNGPTNGAATTLSNLAGLESVFSVPWHTGNDNAYHMAWCPQGMLVRGIKIYANNQLDGNMSVFCTGISRN